MAERSHEHSALVAKTAALIIGRLDDRLAEVTKDLQDLLVSEVAAISGDGELMSLIYDSVQGNLDTFIPAVRHGIPIDQIEAPAAALEHARRLAQRDVDADYLVRTYRLGHEAVLRIVLDEMRDAGLDHTLALDVYEQIVALSFRYIERISHLVLATYQSERDRWLANQHRVRAVRVREVLNTGDVDVDEASTTLRYPLRRTHLALIVWCAESESMNELAVMERFVGEVAKALGAQESPLFVAADSITGWAWIALSDSAAAQAGRCLREFAGTRSHAPSIAAGDPLPGVDGFRRSHEQAHAARAVVLASESQLPAVTMYSDPGVVLAAQFCADLTATRAWIGDILGPLASPTDSDERMRETLRAFLHTGSSFKTTADELHLHVNSVKYRVQRALERRGKPVTSDRVDVEVALSLCHWLGTAVLN